MKKCPVCGVMMGDNVARCFMCKYDFQKAAREGEEAARKDATVSVFKGDQEAGRAAEKKAEGEKILADTKAKNRLEIEALGRQLEGEKIRLEQEYVEIRKKSLLERSKLDEELSTVRKRVEEETALYKDSRTQREKLIEGSKAAAKAEADKILDEVHLETQNLAEQVRKEYADAMAEKQQVIDETSKIAIALKEEQKKFAEMKKDLDLQVQKADGVIQKAHGEAEKIKKAAELESEKIKKQSEIDAAAAIEDARKSCSNVVEESERVRQEVENTKKMAEAELAAYIKEAKAAIVEAEAAQAAKQKVDEEVRAVIEQAEYFKVHSDEVKRNAEKEEQEILQKVEEIKKKALHEEQANQKRAMEAEKKAKEAEQVFIDDFENTKKLALEEIDLIAKQRQTAWETAEQEAVLLTKELQEAKDMTREAQEARKEAEEKATEAKRAAAEEAEKIILEAQKRAIVLKELGISQSEKGRISSQYEESVKVSQAELAALQKALSDREEDLKISEQKVRDIMDDLENLRSNQLRTGFVPVSVPMDYEVEIIKHKTTGEVDSDAIAETLARRGTEGWKLHSIMNDEGGRLQASLGASEQYSLSSGASYKEDRVILIFERVAEKVAVQNEQNPSSHA